MDTEIETNMLYRAWWLVLLRGLAGILFGIIAFAAPLSSLAALIMVFGAYAFADGVVLIVSAVHRRDKPEARPTWALWLNGLVGIAIGLLTLFRPAATALGLLWMIAVWAVLTGALEIGAAISLRKAIKGEWLLGLGACCRSSSDSCWPSSRRPGS